MQQMFDKGIFFYFGVNNQEKLKSNKQLKLHKSSKLVKFRENLSEITLKLVIQRQTSGNMWDHDDRSPAGLPNKTEKRILRAYKNSSKVFRPKFDYQPPKLVQYSQVHSPIKATTRSNPFPPQPLEIEPNPSRRCVTTAQKGDNPCKRVGNEILPNRTVTPPDKTNGQAGHGPVPRLSNQQSSKPIRMAAAAIIEMCPGTFQLRLTK